VENYVVYTYSDPTATGSLYTNGVLVGVNEYGTNSYSPGRIGGASGTANNHLGPDPYNDPQFNGTIYEFRIWNGVVPQRYLEASTIEPSSVLINNLTPTSVSLTAGASLVVSATEVAQVTVQLPQTGTANLLATLDATNWTSSNPNVIKVNSQGLIVGVGVGSATVSAKVAGISATSGTITVTGPQQLIHRYSFVSDATDSVGADNGTVQPAGNANGTNVTISNGAFLPGGGGGTGSGAYSGYVGLPADALAGTTSLSIETWLTQAAANTWAEAWDFANNTSQNFGLITDPGNNSGKMEVAFTPHGNEVDVQSAITFPNDVPQHVVVTYDNYNLVGKLYLNGVLVGTANFPDTSYMPSSFGGTGPQVNALSTDIYGDTEFQGTNLEFRIWNGAVSPAYVAASDAAGPGVVINSLTPTSLTINLGSTSMLGAGTQQATVTGNFAQVSNVTLTGAATNWVSSNPTILTVSSSGLITALNGGTATVSATVDGVTATSATITVATTAPTFALKPTGATRAVTDTVTFNSLALGGSLSYQWSLNSTPIPGATNSTLTLTNLTFGEAGTYTITVTNSLGSTNASVVLAVQSAILLHRYSFVSDASDSVGGANGTIVPPTTGTAVTIANGLQLAGGGGPGTSGYVTLPGGLLTNTTSITIETWVTQNSANQWGCIWDFDNGQSEHFALCPDPARNNGDLFVEFDPNNDEIDLSSPAQFPNGVETYVAMTYNDANVTGLLFTNGTLIGTQVFPNNTYAPGRVGGATGTPVCQFGQDPYPDPQFQGTVYEFRVWDGAVSPVYVAIANVAGPGVVVTNLTPTALVINANTTMTGGQTQQATVTGNFVNASGIDVTAGVTNWTSSNKSALTVSSSGLISAVGTGSSTISAVVNGVTATLSISVPNSKPFITMEPPAAETLVAGATLDISVAANGTMPFTYYWFTNNSTVPLSVSASPTLKVVGVQMAANGNNYTCVVSNQYGTTASTATALTVIAPTPYEQTLLQYRPLAYWPLNEASGTIAYDVVGGNNGMYIGGVSLQQAGPTNSVFGADSFGVAFDGYDSYVDVPEGPFNITNAITIVAWIGNVSANGFDGIVGHGDTSWRLSLNGSLDVGANDGTAPPDATDLTPIGDTSWHQVVYTYNGFLGTANNGALYVDGAVVANNELDSPPAGNDLDVWIGGAPDYGTGSSKRLMLGNVADVSVFQYGFTASQVTALYNGTYVASPTKLTIAGTSSGPTLNWQAGVLLQAPSLSGPWTPNYSAVPPFTVPVGSGNQFYRLLVNP
jgi:uncharacterized protein YjdB